MMQQQEEVAIELTQLLPHLTPEDQTAVSLLFHASFRRTDPKLLSANKFYSQSIPDIIKKDDIIVQNGNEWRRYTYLDAVVLQPVHIKGDGACERVIPSDCLNFRKGYAGEVSAFLRQEIFDMRCSSGDVHFDTRQEQQSKRRDAIEAKSNEGISSMDLYDDAGLATHEAKGSPDLVAGDAHPHNPEEDDYKITPPRLLSKGELIAKYGQLKSTEMFPYVKLFDIHALLKSLLDNMADGVGSDYRECMLDDGGNFITNKGGEKILMYRKSPMPNITMSQFKKNVYFVECRSEHTNENRSTSTFFLSFTNDKLVTLDDATGRVTEIGYVVGRVSAHLQNVPFVVWMRALGVESVQAIREMYHQACGVWAEPAGVNGQSISDFHIRVLERCFTEDSGIKTTLAAILHLGRLVGGKTKAEQWYWGNKKLRTEILPHVGKSPDPKKYAEQCLTKARHMCHMMQDLLLTVEYDLVRKAQGHLKKKKDNMFITNRDSYIESISQTIDELMSPLVQQYIRPYNNKFIPQIILKKLDRGLPVNPYEVFPMFKISNSVNYNLSMGIWHSQPGIKSQTGVSQNIAQHNYIDRQSQHDKVMNPIHKEGKQIDPRLLPEDGFATVCCVDSPEGEASGIHRQKPQYGRQALSSNPEPLIKLLLQECGWSADGERSLRLLYSWDERVDGSNDPGLHPPNGQRPLFWNVYVNQVNRGFTFRPDALLRFMRRTRRKCMISSDISENYGMFSDPWEVYINDIQKGQSRKPVATSDTYSDGSSVLPFDEMEPYLNTCWYKQAELCRKYRIEIRTHSARNMRELFVVENLYKLRDMMQKKAFVNSSSQEKSPISLLTHQDLLINGIVEYVDVAGTLDCLIAIDADALKESVRLWQEFCSHATYPALKRTNTYTHAELHPSVIFGLSAGLIVFAQCNPPARLAFASHMRKHAQGKADMISLSDRMPTNYNEKWYAERSAVSTDIAEALGEYRLSVTTDHEIAICCGANEEDSQDMNGSITELGYFASSNYHLMTTCEHRHKTKTEKIGLFPPEQCSGYKIGCDYSKLDKRGLIVEGAEVSKNTILVQKCIDQMDASLLYRSTKRAVVDRVFWFHTEQNLMVVNVILRETRMTDVGDKNASGHAQKGVVCRLRRRENMRFNFDTLNFPDVVYNSSAFISRLTLAMYLEMLFGELAAIKGTFVNATAFTRNWTRILEYISDELREKGTPLSCISEERRTMGLHPFGSHSVIDARTGKRVSHNGRVFTGFCGMQKLKQMAIDKMRARGLGPTSYATKQPVDSKQAHGNGDTGQKCGIQELQSMMGYGAAEFIYDRMLVSSDPAYTHPCKICNNNCIYIKEKDMTFCLSCEKTNSANKVFGSATFQLFCNELLAIGLIVKQHA